MSLFGFFSKGKRNLPEKAKESASIALKKYIISLAADKHGLTVLEAGACGGEDSVEWASLPEISKVYAFEPVNKTFDLLKKKVNGHPKVELFKMALSNSKGETEIFISSDANNPNAPAGSSSILKPTGHLDFHGHIKFDEKEIVQLETIDGWAATNNVKKVDIMWLDMQGAEHKALEGAANLLRTTQLIYSEVSLKPMYSDSLLYPDYAAYLRSFGFEVEKEFLEWEDMGNVLFRKKF